MTFLKVNCDVQSCFWDILPCKMIVDRRFRGAYCLHHQGGVYPRRQLWTSYSPPWELEISRKLRCLLRNTKTQKRVMRWATCHYVSQWFPNYMRVAETSKWQLCMWCVRQVSCFKNCSSDWWNWSRPYTRSSWNNLQSTQSSFKI
jgi:hypothetical protein